MAARNGLIDGQEPDSRNEYNVAVGLDRLELDYIYQYEVFGGRIRGGQVIDFLVLKAPQPVPVYVGVEGYWHGSKQAAEDLLKRLDVQTRYPDWAPAVDITEEESQTVDKAYAAVKEKIGP